MVSIPVEQLEAEVLHLPLRERARLVRRLIESLDEEAAEDPTEVEQAWEEEIRRRLAEFDAGRAQAIPASEVFSELRTRLT